MAEQLVDQVELIVVTSEGGTPLPGAEMVFLPQHRSRLGHYYIFPFHARRAVEALKPDVVHAFGDDWALKRTAPIVRTFHGSSWEEARASTGLRRVNHYVLGLLERRSRRRCNVAIAIAPPTEREFHTDLLMPPVARIPSSSRAHPSDIPTAVFLGTWDGRKRGSLAYAAIEHASQALETEVALTVIGNAADKDRWPSDVKFVAGASDLDVQGEIARAWVLLAPSSYEGFGIPAFEALSLGVPVVASPNPGADYVQSAVDPNETLMEVVRDDEFRGAVADRLSRGARAGEADTQAAIARAGNIADGASVARLVSDIYLPLTKGKDWSAMRRRPPEVRLSDPVDGLTVCICTRNRIDELRAALTSLMEGTTQPDAIIVSDDGEGADSLAGEFPFVTFLPGPKRGLGPNRNACLTRVATTRVCFIDDDVKVSSDFVERARRASSTLVTTGWELNFATGEGKRVESSNPSFLGFQDIPVAAGVRSSIVINATVFPRELFDYASFDERSKYGYEELDIARQAVRAGYRIAYDKALWVEHHPSNAGRESYAHHAASSRIYLTHRAYRVYDRAPVKAAVFLAIAVPHHLLASIRRGNLPAGLRSVRTALASIRASR